MTSNCYQIHYSLQRRIHLVTCLGFLVTILLLTASSRVSAFSTKLRLVNHVRLIPKSSSSVYFSATELAHLRVNGHQQVSTEEQEFYVHGIVPKTNSITESIFVFAKFVVKRLIENRQMKLDRRSGKAPPKRGIRANLKTLNEQRRNLSKLAGYNAPIIVPSFTFLLLGALTTSVIPHFYSDCIQCVATLDPSRAKCMRALAGLAITSTLGAFFTGMRGSLFWVAGELNSCHRIVEIGNYKPPS